MSRCRRFVILAGGGLLLCLAAFVMVHKDLAVAYHRNRMAASLAEVRRVGPNDPKQGKSLEAYEKHRDCLVALGYFERREFPLVHISVPSLKSRRLWEELQATFPNHNEVMMQGYELGTKDLILVWDRPQNLPAWERIISAHDQPVSGRIAGNVGDLSKFMGTWINDEGKHVYVISSEPDGSVNIVAPATDTWRIEIKNAVVGNGQITFDEYHYMVASNDFKSPIDKSGEHPFSGVRCETILTVNSHDLSRMDYNMKTIHTPQPIVGILRRAVVDRTSESE